MMLGLLGVFPCWDNGIHHQEAETGEEAWNFSGGGVVARWASRDTTTRAPKSAKRKEEK
jgi:hypothetical protein